MPPRSRTSATVEQIAKPPVDLHPSCVIEGTAQLTGTHLIRIGANTIVHPRARLNSTHGPITIGEGCIISERCLIQPPDIGGVAVENGVLIECNAIVEGKEIREGTDVEVGVRIGKGAIVGKVCPSDFPLRRRISMGSTLETSEPHNTCWAWANFRWR